VVVVQEIFGVNDHIRAVVNQYAGAGYVALAPAFFDRVERGVELGYDEESFARGRALVGNLAYESMLLDLDAASEAARGDGKAGAMGYCFGGAVVWVAAAAPKSKLSCAVSYYGSRITNFMDKAPRIPMMLHVGRLDASLPMDKVHALGSRYPEVVIHEYDAGHGFNCNARPSYQPEAAALAFQRTLAFLGEHVG
jgi:carboxymethylenebutenolidase